MYLFQKGKRFHNKKQKKLLSILGYKKWEQRLLPIRIEQSNVMVTCEVSEVFIILQS